MVSSIKQMRFIARGATLQIISQGMNGVFESTNISGCTQQYGQKLKCRDWWPCCSRLFGQSGGQQEESEQQEPSKTNKSQLEMQHSGGNIESRSERDTQDSRLAILREIQRAAVEERNQALREYIDWVQDNQVTLLNTAELGAITLTYEKQLNFFLKQYADNSQRIKDHEKYLKKIKLCSEKINTKGDVYDYFSSIGASFAERVMDQRCVNAQPSCKECWSFRNYGQEFLFTAVVSSVIAQSIHFAADIVRSEFIPKMQEWYFNQYQLKIEKEDDSEALGLDQPKLHKE